MEGLPSYLLSLPMLWFSPSVGMLNTGLSCVILCVGICSSYSRVFRAFTTVRGWSLSNSSSESIEMILWFLSLSPRLCCIMNMVLYIYLHMNMILYIFAYAAPSLHFRNESHSVMVLFVYNTTCCYSALKKWGKEGNIYQIGESQTHRHLSSRLE